LGGVSVESGGGGGKKAVDANINMVPMIDLLVSCIAFLLMTAVWVQTGAVQAQQPRQSNTPAPPINEPPQQLKVSISPTGYRVGITAADMQNIDHSPQQYDQLRTMLDARHRANQQNKEVWLQPDGAVEYNEIIRVMDIVYGIWGHAEDNQVTIRFL
jgi:biopolymer transport protein ExbD